MALNPIPIIFNIQWSEEVVPTIAFNFRKVRKGNVTLKIWDVAGASERITLWNRCFPRYYFKGNLNFAPCGKGIATEPTL